MKICYSETRFTPGRLQTIETANQIIREYRAQGFRLTLRQLFYQFVARDLLPNTTKDYKRLGDILNSGRLSGLVDWLAIEDRTRNLRALGTWDHPGQILRAAANSFRLDKWSTQRNYVEVWVEKDALLGIVERACNRWECPFFSCRGYVSQSELWAASQRIGDKMARGKRVTIFHFGDHDPSGIDMTRDLRDRMLLFLTEDWFAGRLAMDNSPETRFRVKRLALNRDQVARYNPPPNPAKLTDSRAAGYIKKFGRQSWELDALEPTVLASLIGDNIGRLVDREAWNEAVAIEQDGRDRLIEVAEEWEGGEADA